MRPELMWAFLLLLMVVGGCGRRLPPPPSEPLTVEEWKEMPVETKYEIPTLERLKAGEPKLQDDREWARFASKVLVPARKKDLSGGAQK